MARPSGRAVREELIESATDLIQQLGVNGFSYGDLAKQLDIKAPSIHHHFRTKEDLIAAVAERYRQHFNECVANIDEETAAGRLGAYTQLFTKAAELDRMCLCGAVAAEWLSVGEAPRSHVEQFFNEQIEWLTEQVALGADTGEFRADLDAGITAATIFATLEGSMLMSRAGRSADLTASLGSGLVALLESA